MPSIKHIRNRIKSIQNTMQITKAMELVAVSRLGRAVEKTENSKPYFNILREALSGSDNREGRSCHVVIAGDRGLALGYNSNVFASVEVRNDDIILPIGKKTVEHFAKHNVLTTDFERVADITLADCRKMGSILADAYQNGKFDCLFLTYTNYVNMLTQTPKTERLLPIRKQNNTVLCDMDEEEVRKEIIPYYISGMLYGAVNEAVASELSSRRNAMESATENASEMLDSLRTEYNRARQASITQELTEIVAGSENLG